MSIFDFIKKQKIVKTKPSKKILGIGDLIKELGIAREGVITSYDTEENPDDLGPETYIEMQGNDGEVQAIVRLLSLPVKATPFHIVPAENDHGERDFINNVFTAPYSLGGMTTPLPFIIADMTRAVFEGFRLYEKVARIIPDGIYKGKIGWKKLAPRDAQTIALKTDEHGGFNGATQNATFGGELVNVDIPPEKCILFTFQKEKHWLYGESILKAAYYHYDKKHKLYYIAHKKAEIESTGLKILKIGQTLTSAEREAAETTIDTIGINSRVTLPPGVELEIERGGGNYDPLPLIQHHNLMMARSALIQAVDQVKYAYPYGKGTTSSQFLVLSLESIMAEMEATLNTYAIAPLIDLNFNSQSYPQIKFEKISDASRQFLMDVFRMIMKQKDGLPEDFVEEVIYETAKQLNLNWALKKEKPKKAKNEKALIAFEKGKVKMADKLHIDAPPTPKKLKEKLLKVGPQEELENKCFKLGEEFAYVGKKK